MADYILPQAGPKTVILADNRDPWTSWRNHLARGSLGGVDVVAAVGTPVYAPANGTVTNYSWNGSGGHTVSLYQTGGWKDHFMHLSRFAVANNSVVKQGQLIGWTGRTANGSVNGVAPHLHWHRIDPKGIRRNPWDYFGIGQSGDTNGSVYGYGLTKAAQEAAQKALQKLNLYSGQIDGAFGQLSVRGFQQYLKNVGLLPPGYEIDGEPGPMYGEAIQNLAKKHGYTGDVDGKPGALTSEAIVRWAATITSPAPVPTPSTPPTGYGYGLSEAAQRAAQEALAKLKLYTGNIDGDFGSMSVKAMQQYLKNAGILPADYEVDGEPGPKYGAALQTLAARHGYTGEMDGQPGSLTSQAIERWAVSILVGAQPTPTPTPTPPAEGPRSASWGIDVATSQANIDFASAKAEGVQFVIVKMGGANVLPIYVAPNYHRQIDGAKAQGLPVGHYYVSGKGDARVQADYFVDNLYRFNKTTDILVLDNEQFKTDNPNTEFWDDTKSSIFLSRVIERTGINPERVYFYGYAAALRGAKPWNKVNALGVRLWWASYGSEPYTTGKNPTHEPDLQGAFPDWHIHQYTDNSRVAGMNLDANASKLTVDQIFNIPEVTPQPEPVPDPKPDPLPEPDPKPEPTPTPTPAPDPDSDPAKPGSKAWIVAALTAVIAAISAIIAVLTGNAPPSP